MVGGDENIHTHTWVYKSISELSLPMAKFVRLGFAHMDIFVEM
jgi:hypothetical protein